MSNTFRITVRYNRTPGQMMEAAGCKQGTFATELFPNKSGTEEIEVILMTSPKRSTPAMIRADMRDFKRRGLNTAELLALVETFRATLGSDKIVALGSWETSEDGTQAFPSVTGTYFQMIADAESNDQYHCENRGFNQSYRYATTPKLP